MVHDLETLIEAASGQSDLLQSLDRRIEEIVAEPPAGGSGSGSGDQDHGSAAGGVSPQPRPSGDDSGGGSGNQGPESAAGGVSSQSKPSAGSGGGSGSRNPEPPAGTASAGDQPSGFEPWKEQLLELKRRKPQTPVVMLLPQLTVEPPTLDQAADFLISPEAADWMRRAACSPPPAHPLDGELEPWQTEALRQRRQHPGEHAFSLLMKLDSRVSTGVNGRRLAQFFVAYDQRQEERRREAQDL